MRPSVHLVSKWSCIVLIGIIGVAGTVGAVETRSYVEADVDGEYWFSFGVSIFVATVVAAVLVLVTTRTAPPSSTGLGGKLALALATAAFLAVIGTSWAFNTVNSCNGLTGTTNCAETRTG